MGFFATLRMTKRYFATAPYFCYPKSFHVVCFLFLVEDHGCWQKLSFPNSCKESSIGWLRNDKETMKAVEHPMLFLYNGKRLGINHFKEESYGYSL